MRLEFNKQKNEHNLARHGVDFATAALIFDDPYAMTIRDVLHDEDEERTTPLANLAQARFSLLFTHCSPMKRAKK
jgi:uncharacterized DUF497 family protein